FTISMVSVISWLPIPDSTILKILHHLFTYILPSGNGEQIYHQIKIFIHQSRHLSVLGFGSLLITTYLMIFAIEKQLNVILNNKNQRKFGHSLLIHTLFLICGIILTILVSLLQLSNLVIFNSNIIAILNQSISFLITILLFTLIYKIIPRHKVAFKHAFLAATAATIIFFLIRILFIDVLVKIFVNYHVIYGSLSFIPIFMLWVYLSCINLFLCAGIIYALETKFDSELQQKINSIWNRFGVKKP
ncbi:MAG TPA: YihY/virulence factor BrkB family protein, partial [Aquella sp.]|nr:YihY/virulence factor BrkB family protein [Aquella sp.]